MSTGMIHSLSPIVKVNFANSEGEFKALVKYYCLLAAEYDINRGDRAFGFKSARVPFNDTFANHMKRLCKKASHDQNRTPGPQIRWEGRQNSDAESMDGDNISVHTPSEEAEESGNDDHDMPETPRSSPLPSRWSEHHAGTRIAELVEQSRELEVRIEKKKKDLNKVPHDNETLKERIKNCMNEQDKVWLDFQKSLIRPRLEGLRNDLEDLKEKKKQLDEVIESLEFSFLDALISPRLSGPQRSAIIRNIPTSPTRRR